jgi:hypothetical protein
MKTAGELYLDAWREYRRRKRTALFLFLGFFPFAGVLGFRLNLLTGSVMVGWMIAFFVATLRFHWWKCPRCGRRFIGYYSGFSYLRRKCFHCGLAIGSEPVQTTI